MKTPHRDLRGLEVICDVADDTLVLLCCLGESKAITLFLTIVCLVVCLASNAFPADFVSVCRMKKSNNKNHKKFFGRPETPASLPWRRETTRHKLNMAENVLVDVIVKVKPNMANRIHCRNFCAKKCCYSVHFQIRSVG